MALCTFWVGAHRLCCCALSYANLFVFRCCVPAALGIWLAIHWQHGTEPRPPLLSEIPLVSISVRAKKTRNTLCSSPAIWFLDVISVGPQQAGLSRQNGNTLIWDVWYLSQQWSPGLHPALSVFWMKTAASFFFFFFSPFFFLFLNLMCIWDMPGTAIWALVLSGRLMEVGRAVKPYSGVRESKRYTNSNWSSLLVVCFWSSLSPLPIFLPQQTTMTSDIQESCFWCSAFWCCWGEGESTAESVPQVYLQRVNCLLYYNKNLMWVGSKPSGFRFCRFCTLCNIVEKNPFFKKMLLLCSIQDQESSFPRVLSVQRLSPRWCFLDGKCVSFPLCLACCLLLV